MENERIAWEEEQRLIEVRAAEVRRVAAVLAEQAAETRRQKELVEEKRKAELTRREEDARVEGVRLSEIEKVRHEAEHQARMSLLTQNQKHEERLALLRQDESKKRLSRWLVGIVGVAMMGALVVYYQAEQQGQRAEVERLALEREAGRLRERISEQERKIAREVGRQGEKNLELIRKLKEDLRHLQVGSPQIENNAPNQGAVVPPLVLGPPNFRQLPRSPKDREKQQKEPCPPGDPMCSTL